MHRRRWVAAVACLAMTPLMSSAAAPKPDDACLTSPVEGQKLRRVDKLLDAHERFAQCARRTCPARIVQECTRWLHEVDDIIPSIVPVARDAQGADLMDVQVSIDDQPASEMSARAVQLDPGPHKLVFHRQGSPDIQQDVLLREGEKGRSIVATFKPPAPPPAPPSPPPVIERPVPVVVWVLGGFAVLGGAGFATFGALGLSERSSDHCVPAGCTQSQKDSIETKLRIGDVSLGVGVLAVVTGSVFFLTRPRVERGAAPAAFVDLQPARGGGVAVVGARF
jgi:hypothetical protein